MAGKIIHVAKDSHPLSCRRWRGAGRCQDTEQDMEQHMESGHGTGHGSRPRQLDGSPFLTHGGIGTDSIFYDS